MSLAQFGAQSLERGDFLSVAAELGGPGTAHGSDNHRHRDSQADSGIGLKHALNSG
jgi:hypothetical protein